MSVIGTVESIWRYPVKSMRGEQLDEVFVGFGGLEGDRRFAFRSSAARPDFPYFTARQQREMLRYRPRLADDSVLVETPQGETLAIDDPKLIQLLRDGVDPQHEVTLMRSDRAIADAYPVSIMSVQTVWQLRDEIGAPVDKRQFRASIYIDVPQSAGFAENDFVGSTLRLGEGLVVKIEERDTRCVLVNLDPDTTEMNPAVLKQVAQGHQGAAGVYGSVVTEGLLRKNDVVEVLDSQR